MALDNLPNPVQHHLVAAKHFYLFISQAYSKRIISDAMQLVKEKLHLSINIFSDIVFFDLPNYEEK